VGRTVLRLLSVADDRELGRFTLRPDDTVAASPGAAVGILRTLLREECADEREAWEWLDRYGWSNGYIWVEPPEGGWADGGEGPPGGRGLHPRLCRALETDRITEVDRERFSHAMRLAATFDELPPDVRARVLELEAGQDQTWPG
jgi:hypothetical protein